MIDEGYIYCFSNVSMPNILKVGMTERTPDIRLSEANASDTWRPPTDYKIEFAKKVKNPCEKEKTLHILFGKYTNRINPRREFFNVSIDELYNFFELMDGEMWNEIKPDKEIIKRRDMKKCFTNGQRLRHKIGNDKIWIGHYDSLKNVIKFNTKEYHSLSKFAQEHIKVEVPYRQTFTANGWVECEYEIGDKWVSTNNL